MRATACVMKAREPDPARAQTYTTNVRRLPDPTSRLLVDADGRNRLGGAVPSPAAAFLLALITLPTLFWLVTLKRTTVYTRPEQWQEARVPEVLVSGNHAAIARWRRKQALGRTYDRRPELVDEGSLSREDRQLLEEYRRERQAQEQQQQ